MRDYGREANQHEPSVVFFNDIAGQRFEKFLDGASKIFFDGNNIGEVDRQLLQQVHAISKITRFKLECFKWEILTFSGSIYTPVVLVLYLIIRRNKEI